MDFEAEEKFYLESLKSTAAWCARHADAQNPSESLRSAALEPARWVRSFTVTFFSNRYNPVLDIRWERHRKNTVQELSRKRAGLLRSMEGIDLDSEAPPLEGNVLIWRAHLSVEDKASQYLSKGFFDELDTPPWDTWIDYITGDSGQTWGNPSYLLAWVPTAMEPFANVGIEANPIACIEFATYCHSDFLDHLRSVGLL